MRIFRTSGLAIFLALAAHGATLTYSVVLDGASEQPANASPGTGTATITFDTTVHSMLLDITFSGLTGITTAAHIHCCTTGAGAGTAMVATTVPTFFNFPLGVTSGTYQSAPQDLTSSVSYNSAFITFTGGTPGTAEAALLAGIAAGQAYLNIHTSTFGGGEIRGFLVPSSSVPEPSAFVLMGAALAGLGLLRRRKAMSSSGN